MGYWEWKTKNKKRQQWPNRMRYKSMLSNLLIPFQKKNTMKIDFNWIKMWEYADTTYVIECGQHVCKSMNRLIKWHELICILHLLWSALVPTTENLNVCVEIYMNHALKSIIGFDTTRTLSHTHAHKIDYYYRTFSFII